MGNHLVDTGVGACLGESPSAKVGFYGSQGSAQRNGSAQAAVSATVGTAVATDAATNSSPYGFTQTQADALVARVNQLRADVLALTTLANELRTALLNLNLIAGS